MRRVLLALGGVVLLALVGGGIWIYGLVSSVEPETVTDGVYMLTGAGGNVGVLRTAKGAVVVDTMTFAMQGERIRERAEELGGGPVQLLVNTHYHGDHTHGNPAFEPGTPVVSTTRTLDHLRALDAGFWEGSEALLPNRTFEGTDVFHVGGQTIEVHHLGRGHTDGDLVVLFVESKVLHTGDLVFHRRYPNIDLEAGGSIEAWVDTLERVLALDFERVIPGHGAVTDAEGIREFQAFLVELWAVGRRAAREGWTLEQTQASDALRADAGYAAISVPLIFSLDRAFVLRRAFEEANGRVTPYDAR